MLTYTWHIDAVLSGCCPVYSQTEVTFDDNRSIFQIPCPGAPRARTIPLDQPRTTLFSTASLLPTLYPIPLTNITITQEIKLADIILTSPVHIHTPTTHLALIQHGPNGSFVTARTIVLDIQVLARKAVEYTLYTQLSLEMKMKLRAAFIQRRGNTPSTIAAWDVFSAGRYTPAGPIGADLLLGCTTVWGLERVSFEGYSVVHLA